MQLYISKSLTKSFDMWCVQAFIWELNIFDWFNISLTVDRCVLNVVFNSVSCVCSGSRDGLLCDGRVVWDVCAVGQVRGHIVQLLSLSEGFTGNMDQDFFISVNVCLCYWRICFLSLLGCWTCAGMWRRGLWGSVRRGAYSFHRSPHAGTHKHREKSWGGLLIGQSVLMP